MCLKVSVHVLKARLPCIGPLPICEIIVIPTLYLFTGSLLGVYFRDDTPRVSFYIAHP